MRVAREALDSAVVTARQAGVVVQRGAHPGEYVQPGRPIVVLADLAGVYVMANLNETDVRRIRPGQPVAITADAYPGRTFRGHIIGIVPAAETELSLIPTRTNAGSFTKIVQWIPVRIAIDSGEHVLAPGMSVTVRLEVAGSEPGTPAR
ncbi:MAG: HlyD family secretion protein [Armatimonadetes bacterium]|nr:HlyD family secretion protein [Armatimonadota bacterium]